MVQGRLAMRSALLLLLLLLLAVAACLAPAWAIDYVLPQRQQGDCLSPGVTVPTTGLFPANYIGATPMATVQVLLAQNFNVTYYSTYKVVVNKQFNETYVLYQCGTAAPAASQIPAGAKVFEIPLKSISVPDTSVIAFLDALNLLDRVAFVTSYVGQPCMQTLTSVCNQTTESYTDKNLVALDIPATIAYAKDTTNTRAIAFSATADPGSVNRAEWLKFIAVFFNKEPEANRLFNSIREAYNAIAAAAQQSVTASSSPRKLVAWIQWWSSDTYGNPCSGPRGAISINYPKFKAQLTADAGARILNLTQLQPFLDNKTALPSPYGPSDLAVWICGNQSDVLRLMLQDADVVIDESRYLDQEDNGTPNVDIALSTFLSQYGLTTDDITALKFLRNNDVLREDGRTNPDSYTQWLERAVLRPDQVLADLMQALSPSVLQQPALSSQLSGVQTTTPYFLRNLARGQRATLLSASTCPLNGCKLPATTICPFVYKACDGSIVYASDTQRCPATCSSDTTNPGALTGNPPGANAPPPSPQGADMPRPASFALLLLLALVVLLAVRV